MMLERAHDNRVVRIWALHLVGCSLYCVCMQRRVALFRGALVESFLLCLQVPVVHIGSLYAFVVHTFFADEVARSIEWPRAAHLNFRSHSTTLL